MSNQIEFLLPEIDRAKTKDAVEIALEKYRLYALSVAQDSLPKITATYSVEPPTFSNQFRSSTEEAAIKNIDYENKKTEYLRRIAIAVNRLGGKERQIIIKRYMQDDSIYDYEVYNEICMSERTYRRLKSRAFYKLAFALKIEVYLEPVEVEVEGGEEVVVAV